MPCYYIMVHFGGPYVTGFVVPQAENEQVALRSLKRILWARIKMSLKDEKASGVVYPSSDFSSSKLKEFMRSIKRPWRKHGEYRGTNNYKHTRKVSGNSVIMISELLLPVHAGYWLEDMVTGSYICNQSLQ